MPYISIESGRLTAEQKRQLIERLTATASGITHIPIVEYGLWQKYRRCTQR